MTNEQKDNLRTWIAALRSGKYEQTTGRLKDETGFCCLGVACEIGLAEPAPDPSDVSILPTSYSMQKAFGLPQNPLVGGVGVAVCNDKDTPFAEIADLLEKEYL